MRKINLSQTKLGIILSYLLIIINAMYGMFLTPFIIEQLGASEYGVFKTVSALSASLMVLDLGLGGTTMRYIAKFNGDKKYDKIPSFIGGCLIQASFIIILASAISTIIYFMLDPIYSESLSAIELNKAKGLYIFLIITLLIYIMENIINGVITGYNHFVCGNGVKVLKVFFRIVLVYSLLNVYNNSIVLVLIDLLLVILFVIIEIIYCFKILSLRISFKAIDKGIFKESLQYTLWMFLTSLAVQVNGNVDNVIIGAMVGATSVTVYSMALLINSMYSQVSSAISGVMLPTVIGILKYDEKNRTNTINEFIIKVGRIQFILIGAAWGGFIILGKQFIYLWLGKEYLDVYYLAIILMTPSLFELIVNVCLSILRANNMLKFRTLVLTGTMICNVFMTIIGLTVWNYYAAAIATSICTLIGSVFIMNRYYRKKFKFNMINIYKNIFSKIWICLVLSIIPTYFYSKNVSLSWFNLFSSIGVFISVYLVTLYSIGLNTKEKKIIHKYIEQLRVFYIIGKKKRD